MKNLFFYLFLSLMINAFGQKAPSSTMLKDTFDKKIQDAIQSEEQLQIIAEAFQKFARIDPLIAQGYAIQGLELSKSLKKVEAEVDFYGKLGYTYLVQNDYNTALATFDEGLKAASNKDLLEPYLNLKMRVASIQLKQGKVTTAALLLDSIVNIAKKEKLPKVEGMAITEMGKMERNNGNYEKSIAYFTRNLEIAQQLKNEDQISYSYLQLAIDYDKTGEKDKSIAFNHKGIALAKANHNALRMLNFYNNLAVNYRNSQLYDSAFFYHEKVLVEQKQLGNPLELARSYMNIGTTYAFQKVFKKALVYYDSAYALVKNHPKHPLTGSLVQNMGSLYKDLGDYKRSNQYNYMALSIAKSRHLKNEFLNLYENLYQSHKGLKQWDSALVYHEKMAEIIKQNASDEKSESIEKVKRELETTQQQKEIDRLQFEKKQNFVIYFSILGALLSGLALFYFWNVNLQRKKKLAENDKKLEEQRVLSLIQEQEIIAATAMLKGQDYERQLVSEELHDGIGSSLATLKLHTENLIQTEDYNPSKNKAVYQKMEQIIADTYAAIRNLSHVKSNVQVEQKGILLALENLAQQINTDKESKVNIQVFGELKSFPKDIKLMLYNTIRELLTNALKHAKANEINIEITQHETELNLLITDNGKGFKVDDDIFKNGLGLYSIRKRVEQMQGSFEIDSTQGKGTTINITIPV